MTHRLISFRSIRIASLTFLGAALAIVGWQQLNAQGIAGFNSNAPVNYAADRIDTASEPFEYVLAGGNKLDADSIRASVKKRQPGLF